MTQSKRVLRWSRYKDRESSGWLTKVNGYTICIRDEINYLFICKGMAYDITSLPEFLYIIGESDG